MRTLVVSRMFPRPENQLSGVFVAEQVRSLRDLGVDVSVLCPVAKRYPGAWRDAWSGTVDGIPVSYVSYAHVPLRLSTRLEAHSLSRCVLQAVRREHARSPIAILHAHQVFPTGFAAVEAGRRLNIPTVCTAHGSDIHKHPHRNRGIARLTRATLRRADLTIAVSRDLASRIIDLEPGVESLDVVYNGVDPDRFSAMADRPVARRELGLPEHGTGICFVGRLVEEKGVPDLVATLRELLRRNHDVWLVLVGGGPLLPKLVADAALFEDRLIVAGPVPHSAVSRYLRAADLFSLPSHGEGVPVAMLEAMACGLPVLATDVGGIPEVLTDGLTGFMFRPRDRENLIELSETLVADPALRRTMGDAGRKVIAGGFHWRHGSEKLIGLYRTLI